MLLVSGRGKFVVYSRGEGDTLVLLLHGGGYSGMTLLKKSSYTYTVYICRYNTVDTGVVRKFQREGASGGSGFGSGHRGGGAMRYRTVQI